MRKIVSICSLFASTLSVLLGMPAAGSAQASETVTQGLAPDRVVYEFYYRRIAFYENLAAEKEKKGQSGAYCRAVIASELATDNAHQIQLAKISSKSLKEADALDKQAVEIIRQNRVQYPDGVLKSKDQLPQLPPKLQELQQSRDAIFDNAKADLQRVFGASFFQYVDLRIKEIILPKIKTTKP
jgi:hypothetical protein